jgi:hypothetical protein
MCSSLPSAFSLSFSLLEGREGDRDNKELRGSW